MTVIEHSIILLCQIENNNTAHIWNNGNSSGSNNNNNNNNSRNSGPMVSVVAVWGVAVTTLS